MRLTARKIAGTPSASLIEGARHGCPVMPSAIRTCVSQSGKTDWLPTVRSWVWARSRRAARDATAARVRTSWGLNGGGSRRENDRRRSAQIDIHKTLAADGDGPLASQTARIVASAAV